LNAVDAPSGIFSRILVGVDGSPESREAARQASVLIEGHGELTLLAVFDVAPAIIGGTGSETPAYFDEDLQRERARDALERTHEALAGMAEPVGKIDRGPAAAQILREIADQQHTLVAVGSHGIGRVRGMVVGSTATELIHKSPCSVLVARAAAEQFPRHIVAGVDGSPPSALARSTAERLAERFDADLRPVVADEKATDALVAAAADADLVVVGSRGLRGLRSLASVSERVAHRAPCSVLIVRGPSASEND
jgi:nucleotide-binding universal stress UspA family protein